MDEPIHYTMRLQRFLARAGVASRRGSETLISAGRVEVNGRVASELGTKVDPLVDEVRVDGRVYTLANMSAFVMLNKPRGVLTTMSDPKGRPCVADLVPTSTYPGLFPVGRLDADTTGLLLFSTDGETANRMLHPSTHVWKHYVALVEGVPSKDELAALARGVMLDDGITQPAKVRLLKKSDPMCAAFSKQQLAQKDCSCVSLRIHEGRKHQVKRMLTHVEHDVVQLHRAAFGPLELGDLAPGSWRELTEAERKALAQAGQDTSTPKQGEI